MLLRLVLVCAASLLFLRAHADENRDGGPIAPFRPTPEMPGLDPVPASQPAPAQFASGPVVPAAGQPQGALSGRIVYMSGGHGWGWGGSSWGLDRPLLYEMVEDFGNTDQMTLFAYYCFNAGATVVAFRPIGNQTNEVVLDNDDLSVSFTGSWLNSTSTVFFGQAGDAVAYRYASVAATETATAAYTPTILLAGNYPVYTWVLHSGNRTNQLYRINHAGGQSLVRVPHHMVGNGWVYLGTYYFNAGSNAASGSVVISNLGEGATPAGVVIADAIRFGNGMGDVNPGGGVSTYPREEESSRYWVQRAVGQGQDPGLYSNGNVTAPPRMAAEMNREQSGSRYKRSFVGFHSNAGGSRGVTALYNNNALFPGTGTSNQLRLAQLLGTEVNTDLTGLSVPPLEVAWYNRGSSITFARSDYAFGEINNTIIQDEFDATIVEVAFHDSELDARLLRDPKVRNWLARATLQGLVRYMNELDAAPLVFLPEPPGNVRATATTNGILVSWNAPTAQSGSGSATSYRVYRSADGRGFGNPDSVASGTTSLLITNLAADSDFYFRVAAANAGGESFPSETVGCRRAGNSAALRALVVNGFSRFNRTLNLRQTPANRGYKPPGHDANSGTMERVLPDRVNAFNYVVPHGEAISAAGWAFDSCQNQAVTNNSVFLTNYAVVVWTCGNESAAEEPLDAVEQVRLAAYLSFGGALLISGSDLAFDLDGPNASPADRVFCRGQLHGSMTNASPGGYLFSPSPGGVFASRSGAVIDDGSRGIYWVPSPDALAPYGPGSARALAYTSSTLGAALQYNGAWGGGRVIHLGFPFETITDAIRRAEYMADALAFLSQAPLSNAVPPLVQTPPPDAFVPKGSNATLFAVALGSQPLSFQWRLNGTPLAGATASVYTRTAAQPVHSGFYDVVITNNYGAVTSAVALVQIIEPPAQSLFADAFETTSAANWMVNTSSPDVRVTFGWDYSTLGIPAAPGVSTTRGLRLEANLSNGVAAALSLSPLGQSFAGNHRVRFHLWMNVNGPFPAGGAGSTQHATAGVGTDGARVQWNGTGSTADGTWFAVDGDGQASDIPASSLSDYGAFTGVTQLLPASGVYAAGTASNARGNNHPYYTAIFPGGQLAPAQQRGTYAQQTGGLAAGTIGFGWREMIVERTGSRIDWSLDGSRIASVTNSSLTASNVFVGYYDNFASLTDNTNLSFGLVDNFRVERMVTNIPPYITGQPVAQSVKTGSSVTFSVQAGGSGPLSYLWRLDGTPIPGANAGSYTRAGVDSTSAGNYSVQVTNLYGSVFSGNAILTVLSVLPLKFDLISILSLGEVKLVLSGEPGTYTIEGSTDLAQWNLVTNVTLSSTPLEFIAGSASNAPATFYRAAPAAPRKRKGPPFPAGL